MLNASFPPITRDATTVSGNSLSCYIYAQNQCSLYSEILNENIGTYDFYIVQRLGNNHKIRKNPKKNIRNFLIDSIDSDNTHIQHRIHHERFGDQK